MIRLAVTFVMYMVVGRWLYSEVQLNFPQAVPSIDYAMEKISIPTHDKWDRKQIDRTLTQIENALQQVGLSATNGYAMDSSPRVRQLPENTSARGFDRF